MALIFGLSNVNTPVTIATDPVPHHLQYLEQ